MSSIEIRPFADGDRDAVASIWRSVFPDAPPRNDPILDIERKLRVQRDLFLVAVAESRVVGTAMAGFDGHRGWLHLVAVLPAYRRRRIGAALVREAASLLCEIGCPKLNLQIRGSSPEAAGFYEKLGFAVEDRISMGLVLPPGRGQRAETG